MRVIEVVDYKDEWRLLFEKEKAKLVLMLPLLPGDIHHIGSTAVPGMFAKPVIDILIEVQNISKLDGFDDVFQQLGYDCKGEFGIQGRRHFQKGGDNRSHHLHAFNKGSKEILRHLAFRDYLRSHPQVAREYSNLKLSLANICDNKIHVYGSGKSDFIAKHEKQSLAWWNFAADRNKINRNKE